MRHFLANIATYTIALLLIGGAALFAWMRSAQLVLTDEETMVAGFDPDWAAQFDWRDLGARSYRANCLNCHGADGEGWDQYPGIGHTGRLLREEGGRQYLIDLHLFGLTSDRWRAPMPPMGHIQDIELAAVINHVLTRFGNQDDLGGAALLAPGEIEARRAERRSPAQVNQDRPDVPY
jgi:mono/diheme cytochrome c family protein